FTRPAPSSSAPPRPSPPASTPRAPAPSPSSAPPRASRKCVRKAGPPVRAEAFSGATPSRARSMQVGETAPPLGLRPDPQMRAGAVKVVPPCGLHQGGEFGMAVGAGIELGAHVGEPRPHRPEFVPALAILLEFRHRAVDQRYRLLHRPERGLPRLRRSLVGNEILGEDEPGAGLAEALRRRRAADAVDIDPLFPDPRGEAGEVGIRRHQAETVEPPGMEEVHRVDDEGDVRRVLARRVGELLLGEDGVTLQHLLPSRLLALGEIAIDPPQARLTDLRHLLEERVGDLRAGVVRIDEDREPLVPVRPPRRHHRNRASSAEVAKPSGTIPCVDWKARIAATVFGPMIPSAPPVPKPRADSRPCSSDVSVRDSVRSPRGQAVRNGPAPAIRSARWPTPSA